MEKTASTPIQLFRGMTADELAALRAAHCTRVQRYDKKRSDLPCGPCGT